MASMRVCPSVLIEITFFGFVTLAVLSIPGLAQDTSGVSPDVFKGKPYSPYADQAARRNCACSRLYGYAYSVLTFASRTRWNDKLGEISKRIKKPHTFPS